MSEWHSSKKLKQIIRKAVIRNYLSKVHCYNGKLLAEILQGCVPSLVMFCIFFSDLDDEVKHMFSTFADVTNLVEKQSKWSWQMGQLVQKTRMNFKKENARSALNLEKSTALTQDGKQLNRQKFCWKRCWGYSDSQVEYVSTMSYYYSKSKHAASLLSPACLSSELQQMWRRSKRKKGKWPGN